nr:photosynthetic complex assembly protein PuhC [Rhodoblastus acidophilus]
MSETVRKSGHHADSIPRGVLFGAGALLIFAFSMAFYGRSSDSGAVHMPQAQPYQTLRLFFTDQADGGIAVTDADSGAVLSMVAPGTNGFLRSTMRGFAHARTLGGIGPQAPFALTRWNDGTLSLIDDTTGRRVDLDAFGPNQSASFAKLFPAAKAPTR